jgi:hypothetical protein
MDTFPVIETVSEASADVTVRLFSLLVLVSC